MATLQARVFLVAFVAMVIAITYNATVRQQGSHPAPISGIASPLEKQPSQSRRAVPRSARTLPRRGEVAAPLPKDKNVIAVQRRLSEAGYDPGPADGVLGDQTRAAIIAFEQDNNLPITGTATETVLKVMIMGASPGNATPTSPDAMPAETTVFIKSVQKTLAGLGYDPGPIDGLIGASTQSAIRKFEVDRKLPVKGRINGRVIKELKDASGGRLSVIASN